MTPPNDTSARLTLALDRLMTDPALESLRRVLGERHRGSAYGDQLDAAADDANQVIDALVAAGLFTGTSDMSPAEIPDWVRLGAVNAFTTWGLGQGSTCPHGPTHHRPAPVFAAAWKPGLVVCIRCNHLLALRRHSVLDRTCDGCGRLVTEQTPDEQIWPSAMLVAELTWSFGACEECRFWTVPDPSGES